MIAWSAAGGESLLSHGIHYALVVGGVLGLGLLLLPRTFHRANLLAPAQPRNELEQRIQILRANVAEGSLLTGTPTTLLTQVSPPLPTGSAAVAEPLDTGARLLLPLAVVSSLAAAGVHAAIGPAHFAQGTLVGLFFAICALLQLAWAGLVMVRPHRRLLVVGAAGNLAVVVLWTATRTVGLPGVLPSPEAVGAWDLASGAWELVVLVTCTALLLSGRRLRAEGWAGWHPVARVWLVGSVVLLGLLSISGASA